MLKKTTMASLYLIGSGAMAEATFDNLATAANQIMDQVNLSRTLMTGANYYAGVGGIIPDGSVTQAQLDQAMVDAYNGAITDVQNATYYNTQMLLEDQHTTAMANLSVAIDDLVAATTTFATVGTVAEMAADASAGTAEDQIAAQQMLNNTDMSITEADVAEYNTAVAQVEEFAQQAAGFLSAANNTQITSSTDNWAAQNGTSITSWTSVTYNATTDMLVMDFYNASTGGYSGVSFEGFLGADFKTAEDVYNTGVYYGG